MTQREYFICTGDLVPDDNELEMPEISLGPNQDGWTITSALRCSKVLIKLEGPVDYTDSDPDEVCDLVAREAQNTAQMWLSVIGFVEGTSYSTRISTIEDSTGCIRKLTRKPRSRSRSEDLGIENAKELAEHVAALSITNEYFRRALHDYVTALNFTLDTPFYLYRALDTLRKHFSDDCEKKNLAHAWSKMHGSLGTSKSEIDALLILDATKIRHGDPLNQQELFNSYLKHYDASQYVRDALLTFLIKNSESDLDLQLPDMGRTINS